MAVLHRPSSNFNFPVYCRFYNKIPSVLAFLFSLFFRKIRQKIFYRYIYSTKNYLVPAFYTCISANSMRNTMLNREEFIFTLLRNIFLQHFSQHSGNMCGTLVLEHLLLTVTGVINLWFSFSGILRLGSTYLSKLLFKCYSDDLVNS